MPAHQSTTRPRWAVPVPGDVEHVQLRCLGDLRWDPGQPVLPHAEDVEAATASDLGGRREKMVRTQEGLGTHEGHPWLTG